MSTQSFDQLLQALGEQHRRELDALKAEIQKLPVQPRVESRQQSIVSLTPTLTPDGRRRRNLMIPIPSANSTDEASESPSPNAWSRADDVPKHCARTTSFEEVQAPPTLSATRQHVEPPTTVPAMLPPNSVESPRSPRQSTSGPDFGGSIKRQESLSRIQSREVRYEDSDDSSRSENSKGMLQPFYEDSVPAYLHEVLKDATASGRQVVRGHLGKSKIYGYDASIALFIFLNALFIGWQVGRRAEYGHEDTPLFDYIVAAIFCLLFGADLCYRIYKQGFAFFSGADRSWNIFDAVIVFLMVLEEILRYAEGEDNLLVRVSFIRTFRLLRFIRILNVVQSLAAFREFRLLVETMIIGVRAMVWVVLIAVSIAYVVGIAMTEGTYDECAAQRSNESDKKILCEHFGRLHKSLLSIYQAIFGGLLWGELMDPLLEINALYPVLFVVMISFVIIIMTNVVTALVLKMVGDIAQGPEAKIREKKEMIAELIRIFNTLDPNRSGDISLEELRNAFDEPRLVGLLANLHLDVNDDAQRFFEMLDRDGTGVIPQKEFVLGCLRLKGEAKAVDIIRLQQQVLEVREAVKSIKDDLNDSISNRRPRNTSVHQQVDDLSPIQRSSSFARSNISGSSAPNLVRDTSKLARHPTVHDMNTNEPEPMLAAGGGVRIPKTEERAMSLKEMRRLGFEIKRRCIKETWLDMRTGAVLEPSSVNLYHLNYNHICPLTTPEGVVLKGLKNQQYKKGQRIAQYDEKSTSVLPMAEGVVRETVTGTELHVTIQRGIFLKPDASGEQVLPIFSGDDKCGEPSFVKSPNALSYKELISTGPQPPKWFCCHWWGEKVFDFIACCESHTKLRAVDAEEASFWVCAYANCQHDLGADITIDPEHSSFRRAMRLAEGILLVLDGDATPFRRIWCDFELYKTISVDKKPLDIVTVHEGQPRLLSETSLPHETAHYKSLREQKFPIRLLVEGMQRSLEDGSASVELDKKRILESMARDVPMMYNDSHDTRLSMALKRANNALHAYFALCSWSFAVNAGIVEDFDQDNRGSLNLSQILSQDQERQRLQLSLAHSTKIVDNDLRVLGQGLPPNLFELTLIFDGCPHIRDAGLAVLAESLPRCLRGFKLDMSNCKEITDVGVQKMMDSLPESLETLELYFANCTEISADGAALIIDFLPKSIIRLAVSLLGTKVNRDFESAAALRKFVAKHKTWQGAAAFMGSLLNGT